VICLAAADPWATLRCSMIVDARGFAEMQEQ